MIEKLRRKMIILVISGLFLVIVAFVGVINGLNWHSIRTQSDAVLDMLIENQGNRPQVPWREHMEETDARAEETAEISGEETPGPDAYKPGEKPDWKPDAENGMGGPPDMPEFRGERPGQLASSREALAGLSNSYTVHLNADQTVSSWSSDRQDLYTDDQVQAMVDAVLASGRQSGRVGTQFFRLSTDAEESLLVVLDARLELRSAQELLRTTLLAGLGVWLLLSVGAAVLIRRMFIPVQQANDRQRQFVWDASHELKTPLAVISANAEVLARQIGRNEWLGYIQSEVERTNGLVQSLLTLARTDRNREQVTMEDVDLSQAVLSVALPFESTLFESGKSLETDVDDGVHVHGNAEMLRQLAVIFLSNATKYSGDGGMVRISLHARGKGAVLSVFNTGSRISDEDRDKIFDRFYRVEKSRSQEVEGYGLGLAIARNILEIHRGRVQVESDERGTSFTVTLP